MGDLLSLIRGAVTNASTAWVLFDHGTVVFLADPEPGCNHAAVATSLLKEWGPVVAGTPAGDFRVISLKQAPGWAVGCHHHDILTFISHDEAPETQPDVAVGLLGRKKRDDDATQLKVRHIEPGDGRVGVRLPLDLVYRELELDELADVRQEGLERFLSTVDGVTDLAAEIARLLAGPDTQEAGCLALLLRPGAEALEALWQAIDDDAAFHYRLVAVAACVDPEAVARARKRLLLGEYTFGEREASHRTCCLLEVVGQHPDYREWIRTGVIDFVELCQMEWLHSGYYARTQLVSLWRSLCKRLPQLDLSAPGERLDLLELCWPTRWKGPFPSKPMRALLVEGKPTPLVTYLIGDGQWLLLEGSDVVRDQAMPLSLPEPYNAILRDRIYGLRGYICRLDPGRWEIRRHGAFYYLDRTPLEKLGCRLVVSGIDQDGTMRGATAAALKRVGGQELEAAARVALAKTDRSLGTVVVTASFGIRFSHQNNHTEEVAHVVSAPQKSPEWLSKAVPQVLDHAERRDILWVGFSAMGTAAGTPSEVAARLMIEAVQQWYAERPQASPRRIVFSLPSDKVYEAFARELGRRRLHFTEHRDG